MARRIRSSRKRESRSQLAERRGNLIGMAIIAVVVIVAGILFYTYKGLDRTHFDPETGCPEDGANSLTLVMIDKSDPISPRQQAFLRNHLEAIKDEIPPGGELKVYTLGVDMESLLEPLVSVCNPGRGSDVNPLTGSQKRAESQWKESFQSRLQTLFDDILNPQQEDWSPIFESIQSISITIFASPQWQDKPKRLILISDLLQYTPEFSHYRGPGNFEEFRRSDYYRRVRTNLSGVEVAIFYLPRPTTNRIQGERHLDFWKSYFLDQGARPSRPALFVHVEG